MTTSQRRAVNTPQGMKNFLLAKFRERGESVKKFANNSDYAPQTINMVVAGVYASPRIRRDIALYLGYRGWKDLMDEYLTLKEESSHE